jgi:hypothetical protein
MKIKFLILILALSVLATSCRKDKRDTLGSSISTDNNTAENLFSDMFKVVDEVSMNTQGIREDILGCVDTVIVDTTSNPKTVLIDFGDNNCTSNDGRVRKGKLHITYTGRYREIGTLITITPENYTVNDHRIEGQKTIENLGLNSNNQLHFAITANGTVTAPGNAWTISWNANRTRTWVEGQSTTTIWDDVYEISGGGSGVNRNGVSYSSTITQPLRAELGCAWLVSGKITIEPEDYATRYIDFGDGTCDSGFTVTVNGQEYQLGSN